MKITMRPGARTLTGEERARAVLLMRALEALRKLDDESRAITDAVRALELKLGSLGVLT